MIMPHTTGHAIARARSLSRVDVMAGHWAAAKYTAKHNIASISASPTPRQPSRTGPHRHHDLPTNRPTHPSDARSADNAQLHDKEKEMPMVTRWIPAAAIAIAIALGAAVMPAAHTPHRDLMKTVNRYDVTNQISTQFSQQVGHKPASVSCRNVMPLLARPCE